MCLQEGFYSNGFYKLQLKKLLKAINYEIYCVLSFCFTKHFTDQKAFTLSKNIIFQNFQSTFKILYKPTWPSLSLSAFDLKPSQILNITSCVSAFLSLPAGHPRRSQIFYSDKKQHENKITISMEICALNQPNPPELLSRNLFCRFHRCYLYLKVAKRRNIISLQH